MKEDWLILFRFALAFVGLFGLAEVLFHLVKLKAEYTRKIVHVGTGFLTLLFPVYLSQFWQVIVLCASFLLLLMLSMKLNFLPSINKVERETSGSPAYPLAVVAVFGFFLFMKQYHVFDSLVYFFLPVLVMAIADPVAALAGQNWQERKRLAGGKSLVGTLAFFITAFIIAAVLLFAFNVNVNVLWLAAFSLVVAAATALVERVSSHGWDNFTIPVTAAILLYLLTLILL